MVRISFAAFLWCFGCAAAGERQLRVVRKTLDSPAEVQGYPCAKGYAWFYPGGGLRACAVSRETSFGEVRVPAGSLIHLSADGKPAFVFLSRDAEILEYKCRGGGHDFMTVLYPTGKLKLCWLSADQEIQGVPCMRAGFIADVFGGGVGTHFYENGALRTCKLSRDFEMGDKKYRRGEHAYLIARNRHG